MKAQFWFAGKGGSFQVHQTGFVRRTGCREFAVGKNCRSGKTGLSLRFQRFHATADLDFDVALASGGGGNVDAQVQKSAFL